MNYQRIAAAVLAAALSLSLAACGQSGKDTADQPETTKTAATPVQIAAVSTRSIATDSKVSGQVAAEDEATIMVAVSAKCTAVYADAGDRVERGQILCTLDLDSTLSQYSAARISYDSAVQSYNDQKVLFDQQIAVAQKQVSVAEEQIPVTREQISASEYQLQASREQVSATEENIAAAEKQLKAAEASISATEENIAATAENIAALEEAIAAGEKQYAAAETQIPVLEKQIELMGPKIALAEKNVKDTEELLAIGAASQMELDNARITLDDALSGREQAIAGLEQSRAALTSQKAGLTSQKASLASSRAGLASQKAGLEQSKAALSSQRAGITSSKAQLAQLKAQLNASQASIDQARAQLGSLELQRDSARVQVQQLQSSRASTMAQLEAGVESARASVQQMDAMLEDVDSQGNVLAPISGTLVTFNAVENSYISNAMPVAVINGDRQMKLTASVSEALVSKLLTGDTADVYVGAIRQEFVAVIRSVERSANVQTKLYTVTLSLPEGIQGLLSGMFADITFHTDRVGNAVVVPSEAILTNGETQYVYIVDLENTAHYREVTTGLTGTGVTQIVSGLVGGERLVTVGQTYLNDGDAVRIVTGS